jgi:glutamyl-tRNA reductase
MPDKGHPPRRSKPILPVALLVAGRRCLVVGGGPVAGRKAEALATAGAEVILVAPKLADSVQTLRSVSGVRILQRDYVPADLERGLFLVITATDNPALNRSILECCRARGLLCACPDTGWENGDFISPASFKRGDLTVSVSTGGAACRRSRLIKESLARHADALGQADLLVIGTDHRFTPLAQRESLHLSGDRLNETAEMLRQLLGIHEFMLLSTCNRVELVALATVTPPLVQLVRRILGFDRPEARIYVQTGRDAFRHLAQVVAGLLSQNPGETHICAQVKSALDVSARAGWSAGVLQDWVGTALHIGKVIRQATQPILGSADVEDLCRDYLAGEWGGLPGRRILVIGSGTIGKGLVERLVAEGARVSCCYHSRVPVFSGPTDHIPVFPWIALPEALQNQDAIVCAIRGEGPLLSAEHLRAVTAGGHAVIVLDFGVPRNVAPDFALGESTVRVADLDAIKRTGPHQTVILQQARDGGNRIIDEHLEDYERIRTSIQGGN